MEGKLSYFEANAYRNSIRRSVVASFSSTFLFSFVDLPTAVEAAEKAESEEAVRKIMLNGRILILRGNNVYTIDGRKAE